MACICLTNVAVMILSNCTPFSGVQMFLAQHFVLHGPPCKTSAHTLVTCAFSHIDWNHLINNMDAFWKCGLLLGQALHPVDMVAFYISGAAWSSVAGYVGNAVVGEPGRDAIGASGAISGMLALQTRVFDGQQTPGKPILEYWAKYMAQDFLGAIGYGRSNVGYWAHLGGGVFGLCASIG